MASITYFSFLGKVTIDNVEITNIFRLITFKNNFIDEESLFKNHSISDGQTPESLARFFYRDPQYYWIILISNKMKDYFYDWPLLSEEIKEVADKTVDFLIEETERELQTGEILETKFLSLFGQTGETFDETVNRLKEEKNDELLLDNETKREIKYLNPIHLNDFIYELNRGRV